VAIALPTKDEMAALPPFDGLPRERIRVPASQAECEAAVVAIRAADVVGFDTESKPIFSVGVVGDGPHVVQFSTDDEAFIFQVRDAAPTEAVIALLADESVLKVGFGLASDVGHIRRRFGLEPRGVVDLNTSLRAEGFRAAVGVRAAIALLLGRRLQKSKRQTTSNWSATVLDDRQLVYAANDAYAALCVYRAMAARPSLDEAR
jgi:ribonuclease D